jgi:hypothetical protein
MPDWLTFVQVWLLVSAAILIAGAGGVILVWTKPAQRLSLIRFVGLLISGLSLVLLFAVTWKIGLAFLILGSGWFWGRWISKVVAFRRLVQEFGVAWRDVVLLEGDHCLGFSEPTQIFFEIKNSEFVAIDFWGVRDYWFRGVNSVGSAELRLRNRELVSRENGCLSEESFDWFYLVIEGSERGIESPAIDSDELEEIDAWVRDKVGS